MGFDIKWVQLMMECIILVQYEVLMNGLPRGHLFPQRGLRQGDLLSPYLYILCTKDLITNIQKEEHDKRLTGLKVAGASPAISHMLFADYSLFLCKTQNEK